MRTRIWVRRERRGRDGRTHRCADRFFGLRRFWRRAVCHGRRGGDARPRPSALCGQARRCAQSPYFDHFRRNRIHRLVCDCRCIVVCAAQYAALSVGVGAWSEYLFCGHECIDVAGGALAWAHQPQSGGRQARARLYHANRRRWRVRAYRPTASTRAIASKTDVRRSIGVFVCPRGASVARPRVCREFEGIQGGRSAALCREPNAQRRPFQSRGARRRAQ